MSKDMISKLEQVFRSNKFLLPITIVFISVVLAGQFLGGWKTISEVLFPISEDQEKEVAQPPLEITFAEGSVAWIALSFRVYLQDDSALILAMHGKYGNHQSAIQDIAMVVRGNAIAALEKHTLDYARKNRKQLSEAIVAQSDSELSDMAYKIESIHLGEFTLAQ